MHRTPEYRLPPLSTPRRVLAVALAWMVLGLTLASASPEAHALVHRSDQAADCDHSHSTPVQTPDHGCAVVLFASGVELAEAIFLPLPAVTLAPVASAAYAKLFLPAPRYLRQPERGPPAV